MREREQREAGLSPRQIKTIRREADEIKEYIEFIKQL